MAQQEASGRREELHMLVDHIRPAEIESVRDYLCARVDPLELALLNAPVDNEPMSEHEKAAWAADAARRERGEPPLTADELLRDLGLTEADLL